MNLVTQANMMINTKMIKKGTTTLNIIGIPLNINIPTEI